MGGGEIDDIDNLRQSPRALGREIDGKTSSGSVFCAMERADQGTHELRRLDT